MSSEGNVHHAIVVDDQAHARDRLLARLAEIPQATVLDLSEGREQVERHLSERRPRCVVCATHARSVRELALLARIQERDPACVLVVVTIHTSLEYAELTATRSPDTARRVARLGARRPGVSTIEDVIEQVRDACTPAVEAQAPRRRL